MDRREDDLLSCSSPHLLQVLGSAARLQELVPDTVLVGGSAAALYVWHRGSFDYDHVLSDLAQRFDLVLEAVESTDGWVTNRVTTGSFRARSYWASSAA
jgi:hypothetical protein